MTVYVNVFIDALTFLQVLLINNNAIAVTIVAIVIAIIINKHGYLIKISYAIAMQLFCVTYITISLVNMRLPNYLCVNKKTCAGERLYWYNAETIESMAVNGSDRTVFLRTPNTIPHGINILGDLLYYTDNR